MTAEQEQLLPPNDPDSFESLCLDLWRDIWGSVNAQKNGRKGQPQNGVDIFGRTGDTWVGIQCKQKDGLIRRKISIPELESEVAAARLFKPSLGSFMIATTGPRDEKIQERVREFCDESFEVAIWSWQDIWHAIYERPGLFARIFHIYWPLQANIGRHISVGSPHAPTLQEYNQPWTMLVRAILQQEVPQQLASRSITCSSSQFSVANSVSTDKFISSRTSCNQMPRFPSDLFLGGPGRFTAKDYEAELLNLKDTICICSTPVTVSAAACFVFLRDICRIPLTLDFSRPSGVSIIRSIDQGAIHPDLFIGGDAQLTVIPHDYSISMFLGEVEDRVFGARVERSEVENPRGGTFVSEPGSTREMAFRRYCDQGFLDPDCAQWTEGDSSKALHDIQEGNPERRAFLWPPLWQFAKFTGKATQLELTKIPHRWNMTVYASRAIQQQPTKYRAICAGMIYAWESLSRSTKLTEVVIEAMLRDESFVRSFLQTGGFNQWS